MIDSFLEQIEAAEQRYKSNMAEHQIKVHELERFRKTGNADWRKLDSTERYVRRMDSLGLEDDIPAVLAKDQELNVLERIIGQNELTSVSIIEGGALAVRTIARIVIRDGRGFEQGFGTGSMISPNLLMTNNHVLNDEETAAASIVQFNYLSGFRGDYSEITFRLRPDIFFVTDRDRDFTIVAVNAESEEAGVPIESRGYTRLIRGSGKAVIGERVNILQHPGGDRLQVVFVDNMITDVTDHFLQYRADTMPGSSGSPVYNQQLELAALHHAGTPERKNGKIMLVDGSPWSGTHWDRHKIKWISNEGVRISRITKFLDGLNLTGNHRELWDQCFEGPRTLDIWALLDAAATGRTPHAKTPQYPGNENVPTLQNEPDGSVSYYFRVNFGPVDPRFPDKTTHPPSTIDQSRDTKKKSAASPRAPPLPSKQQDLATDGEAELYEAAKRHLGKYKHVGQYWDQEEDEAAAEEYYGSIDWSTSSGPLYRSLNKILVNTHTGRFTYSKARHNFLYPAVDLHEDGKLRHIYSGDTFDPVEAIASEMAVALRKAESMGLETTGLSLENILERDEIWDALEEEEAGLPFNCEHVVPQSWFNKRPPMKQDLHHLFTCDSRCNSFRGNRPYFQFSIEDEAEMTRCGRSDNRGFEPLSGKGSVARATMYFLLRYQGEIGDGDSRREMSKNRAKLLIQWHREFPVSDYERHRNQVIFAVQGNRNPFIDRPKSATEALLKLGFD